MTRILGMLAAVALSIGAGGAADAPLSSRASFRIGTSGVLCSAQVRLSDPVLGGMFDRGYAITCRDAAAPVGRLYALRGPQDRSAVVTRSNGEPLTCIAPTRETIAKVGAVAVSQCTGGTTGLPYRLYAVQRGRTQLLAIGLAGYDPALRLGLVSLATDRPAEGAVEVAATAAGDPAAFARAQAGALDASAALSQAYERNNAGNFAEAAEFFASLSDRPQRAGDVDRSAEYLLGQAMQQSNLGNRAGARRLFARADAAIRPGDVVTARLLRNYRAMEALNRHESAAARALLDAPLPLVDRGTDDALTSGRIDAALAAQINAENGVLGRLAGVEPGLLPSERVAILDGQAAQLRGVALRMEGRYADALLALEQAGRAIAAVREGRVASAAFIRSEAQTETALIREAGGDYPAAERALTAAVAILDADYPRSSAVLTARARLAGFLARRGQDARASTLYAEVVAQIRDTPGSAATLRDLLAPYFATLARRAGTDPAAAAALFDAAQVLVRPGVAQTQAVFARELSAGDDRAAALFRQSINLTRQVAQASGEVARLSSAGDTTATAAARARLDALEREQTGVTAQLAAYPRFRATISDAADLATLRAALRPDEAYLLVRAVGSDLYVAFVTPTTLRAYRLDTTLAKLGRDVAALRASVVTVADGRSIVSPFDLDRARRLHTILLGPVGDLLPGVRSLVYEPDGPLLQLPMNLLVESDAGLAEYRRRQRAPGADPFDYRGVAWLGRDRTVTTAVSPRAFVDVRAAAPSRGGKAYLGFGENAPPAAVASLLAPVAARGECDWPLAAWRNPISAAELRYARDALGDRRGEIVTGAAFSDTAVEARRDLADYRILHFATHGLVTAPRPICPARPALLTSFGGAGSDGLLSFREIFDLRLDADVVILSACDTAGMATIEATREAGVTTGGNFALDGLVRAFVGAGARTVVASHWPIPDDYGATQQLVSTLFAARPGTSIADALAVGQRALMDRAETSHPFYWSAFAIVGDGRQPLLRR
ncbi:CHAT domain-containing protein [Sphingomonas adhaesiva]|uniref:CHAT domain-containing protein n=1 Tax=Sphingomonas adhaesiva TaxID=28212 RepID=UPI002FFCD7C3